MNTALPPLGWWPPTDRTKDHGHGPGPALDRTARVTRAPKIDPVPSPRLSLATRFALAGGVVLVVAAGLVGTFVSGRIEAAVVRNTANATAQYMDSFIAPLSQDLAQQDGLSPGALRALSEIFDGTPLGERVVSYKLRDRTGRIAAASDPSIIGRTFASTPGLDLALAGNVVATFEHLEDEEDAGEAALGLPLLEIYSPIREIWSGEVIGVAEFYEVATELEQDLADARRNTWAAVGLVLGAIGVALFLIVLQGSRTISRQQALLARQVGELRELSDFNTALRLRVQEAAGRSSALHDRTLRQVGADLHDGPAQYMAFAALQLDGLRRHVTLPQAEADLATVEASITDAISDIRQISRGLSLPDIEARRPADILRGVAEAHAARTGAAVTVALRLPDDLSLQVPAKICLYRFAQEGLTNAFHHGGGTAELAAWTEGPDLAVSVADRGPGLGGQAAPSGADPSRGMGLAGLRDRVESLGGRMTLANRTDGPGAILELRLEVAHG